MALTVLFDLDDTLLENNINSFLPAYLDLLGKHMSSYVSPDRMVPRLLSATQQMLLNNAPGNTLETAFDAQFYPAIGQTKEALRETLAQFYDKIFPSLQPLTAKKPAVGPLVSGALERGHTLVVATNPIFPRAAVLHRLRWAGLPPEEAAFTLITTYESFHFAKPNPAYYAEIMAQLGWPERGAVIIGDSLEADLMPAAALGIPGFWVTDRADALPENLPPLSARGRIKDALDWIDQVDSSGLKWEVRTTEGLLAELRATPAGLDTLARRLSEMQWQQRPEPAEWSVTEILCHLRDVDAEVNIPRIEKVLAGSNPFLPGVNSDPWTDERKYCNQDGLAALREFLDARSQLIALLKDLPADAWQMPARHAIFGTTHLFELVSFITTHDQDHLHQVCKAAEQLEG